eukprot:325046_1
MEEVRSLKVVEESTGNKEIQGRYHRFNKLLGKGAYKAVYKAFDTISQVDVAWNSIDLSAMTENEKTKVFLECDMLQKLNHSNILKIRDKWSNPEREELCFVTDIIQNGSLRSYFKKRKINLKSVKHICRQILLALEYLHEMAVIHRDLKCDNIFIDSTNSKVVLGDLGLSVNFNGQSRMSIVGTPHWMAPELYNEKYNELVDIWSFGMCVLELVTNTIPYKECKNTIAVYNKVMMQKEKPDVLLTIKDPYIKSFIHICLDFNPALRPTAKELLSHPFLLSRYPRDYILCDRLINGLNKRDHTHAPPESPMIDNNNNLRPPKKTKNRKRHHKNKKKRNKNKTDVKVQHVESKRNITTIKLQIYRKEAKPMAVTFDFNMTVDRPSDVAQEMICELKLPEIYRSKVENAIHKAIESDENNHQTQIVGHSLVMPRGMPPQVAQVAPVQAPTDHHKSNGVIKKGASATQFETDSIATNETAEDELPSVRSNVTDKTEEVSNNAVNATTNATIENDLVLEDISSYLDGETAVEMDEKQKEQIAKKREELLKEYADLIVTKQELLSLRIDSITDAAKREEVIVKMKQTICNKKSEIIKQYSNYISDHVTLAQYTATKQFQQKNYNHFIFEKDPKFVHFMQSPYLTQNDKYELENELKD